MSLVEPSRGAKRWMNDGAVIFETSDSNLSKTRLNAVQFYSRRILSTIIRADVASPTRPSQRIPLMKRDRIGPSFGQSPRKCGCARTDVSVWSRAHPSWRYTVKSSAPARLVSIARCRRRDSSVDRFTDGCESPHFGSEMTVNVTTSVHAIWILEHLLPRVNRTDHLQNRRPEPNHHHKRARYDDSEDHAER
jgi:hypothetical protein